MRRMEINKQVCLYTCRYCDVENAVSRLAPPEVKTAAPTFRWTRRSENPEANRPEGSPFCLVSNTPVTGWSPSRNGKRFARRGRAFARRGKGAGRSDRIGPSKGGKVASSAPSHLACLVAVSGWSLPRMGDVCDGTRTRIVMGKGGEDPT
jgi:hypothetical protein